jgi:hypothetical protein
MSTTLRAPDGHQLPLTSDQHSQLVTTALIHLRLLRSFERRRDEHTIRGYIASARYRVEIETRNDQSSHISNCVCARSALISAEWSPSENGIRTGLVNPEFVEGSTPVVGESRAMN